MTDLRASARSSCFRSILKETILSRFWSLLFFSVPVLATVTFVMAVYGMWPLAAGQMPPSFSTAGETIDGLFYGIHGLAVVILLLTGGLIGFVLWRFDHRRSESEKARYFSHNTFLEVVWTLIPAAILVFLAFYQMDAWAENKMVRPLTIVNGVGEETPPMVLVKARQFGWEFHYAGDDGIVETADDLYVEGLLVVPRGENVVLQLESRDVIHSFFVPELRLKQDVVPGMSQFAWFNSNQTGEVDILCTELCGWGHYKMKARLRIVEPEEYAEYLRQLRSSWQAPLAKNAVQPSSPVVAETGVASD